MARILVIHINSFNDTIIAGYTMNYTDQQNVGDYMTTEEVIKFLQANPHHRVTFYRI